MSWISKSCSIDRSLNKKKVLIEVIYKLNEEWSHEIKKLKDEKERFLKSKYRYWFIVRLKAIKYKKNFFCYLFSYFYCKASLQAFLSLLSQDVFFFSCQWILYHLFCHLLYLPSTLDVFIQSSWLLYWLSD